MKIQFLLISATLASVAYAGYSVSDVSGYINTGHADNSIYHQHVPIIHNGVPVETPEVQAAKAAHFEAYARASALAAKQPSDGQYHERSYHGTQQTYQPAYQPQQYSVKGYPAAPQQYVPVDTPEVQQAKAAHYAAKAQVEVRSQHHAYRYKRGIYSHESGPQYIPKIINGVPEETPEVQLAKYQHEVARQVAESRSHGGHEDASYYQAYNNEPTYYHNDGYYHIPVIGKDGVPIDTPEVRVARQQHLLAFYIAKSGDKNYAAGGGYSDHIPKIGPNGVPYDTPEVQIARAEHLKAIADESVKHNPWAVSTGYGGGYSHY